VSYRRRLVTSFLTRSSRIWDTPTGQCLRTIIHEDHAPVVGVKFSPNGKYVLAWTLDNSIRLWHYISGRCVKTYQGHSNSKFSITGNFGTYGTQENPGAFLVSGSEDGAICIWDVGSKSVLQTIEKAHAGVVFGTDTHPSSQYIVSGGADKMIRLWQLDDST
jgi:COMPASS component SWD3